MPFLGGILWIDLFNTTRVIRGKWLDLIATDAALANWARRADIAAVDKSAADDIVKVQALRAGLADVFDWISAHERLRESFFATLKDLLFRSYIARVFSDAELADAVRKIAIAVANSAPSALKSSKSLFRNQQDRVAEHMMVEGSIFAEQLKSPDFAESIAAMIQKRSPVYA